jgi:hypothetical protein
MPLKYKYKSKDELPAEHQSLYTERDGAWFLNAEGVADSSSLDELRKQKTALEQQLGELNKRFEGIDPDNVRAQLEQKRKLEEEHALKSGEFDKVLQSRTQTMRSDFEKQLSAITGERDTLNKRLTEIQINQGVIIAGTQRGLRPSAIPDITARARSTFKLVNGVPRAFEPDGSTVRVGRDGATPMTVEEWIDSQLSDAPHLFEPNSGSGASGNSDTSSRHQIANPWKRETWNLTKQGELLRNDPAKARAFQAAAK